MNVGYICPLPFDNRGRIFRWWFFYLQMKFFFCTMMKNEISISELLSRNRFTKGYDLIILQHFFTLKFLSETLSLSLRRQKVRKRQKNSKRRHHSRKLLFVNIWHKFKKESRFTFLSLCFTHGECAVTFFKHCRMFQITNWCAASWDYLIRTLPINNILWRYK